MEVINGIRPSVFANWLLSKLGSSPRLMVEGAEGAVSFCDCISKGWLPSPRGRRSWVVKWARVWEKVYISKVQRKDLQ